MTAEQLAQWVIDNRYPKSENNKVSDFEMFHFIVKESSRLENYVPKIEEDKLRQLFRNNSDCYTDGWTFDNDGNTNKKCLTQALTEDGFIKLFNLATEEGK